MPSIVMTLVAAALLLGTSIAIDVYGGREKEEELQSLMTAHNVAELLIHEKKYPALLIGKRLIVSPSSSFYPNAEPQAELEPVDLEATPAPKAPSGDDLEQFRIQHLSLVHQEDDEQVQQEEQRGLGFFICCEHGRVSKGRGCALHCSLV